MREESLFTVTGNNKDAYTEMAGVLESIRLGTPLPNGRNLKTELTAEEKKEAEDYIMRALLPEIHSVAKARAGRAQLSFDNEEVFEEILIEVVYKEFHKFNKDNHILEKGKKYELSSFIGQLAKTAMREMLIEERGLPINAVKNLRIITDLIIKISSEKEIGMDEVTAEMIFEELKDRSISYDMVVSLLRISRGNVSIGVMDDEENQIPDKTTNVEDAVLSEFDSEVKAAFDSVFACLSNLELFLFMQEAGYFGESIRRMTIKELSYKDFFIKLVKKDPDGEGKINHGDIRIDRPGRNSGTSEGITIESVDFVQEKFCRNKVAKVKKSIAKLGDKISYDEILRYMRGYCLDIWKQRNS